ncbi:hypothetical protein KJY78_01170 [Canibacter sp. lx-45]|uniref:hypothetical protein n=1 Tax=Canibacter zhuwentaonis TaxID=2837491 RepID=UPI001BDD6813|nr:hypothetical protein [Canibacter zhuwentaonis]MBT1034964.1 hypothetical protein [Canibacter zhuwentaonis]
MPLQAVLATLFCVYPLLVAPVLWRIMITDIEEMRIANRDTAQLYLLTSAVVALGVVIVGVVAGTNAAAPGGQRQTVMVLVESVTVAAVLAVAVAFLGLCASFISRNKIGFGDTKLLPLLVFVAVLVGGVEAVLVFAAVTAVALALILVVRAQWVKLGGVPAAPALVIGFCCAYFVGGVEKLLQF